MHVKNWYFSPPVYPPETDNWSSQESCSTPRTVTVTFGNHQNISLTLRPRCFGQTLLLCNALGPPNWAHLVDGNTWRETSPLPSKNSGSILSLKKSTVKDKKGVAWVLLYHSALWLPSGSLGCLMYRTGGIRKWFWFITPIFFFCFVTNTAQPVQAVYLQDVQRSVAQQVQILGSVFCLKNEPFRQPLKINTYRTWEINRFLIPTGIKEKKRRKYSLQILIAESFTTTISHHVPNILWWLRRNSIMKKPLPRHFQ